MRAECTLPDISAQGCAARAEAWYVGTAYAAARMNRLIDAEVRRMAHGRPGWLAKVYRRNRLEYSKLADRPPTP